MRPVFLSTPRAARWISHRDTVGRVAGVGHGLEPVSSAFLPLVKICPLPPHLGQPLWVARRMAASLRERTTSWWSANRVMTRRAIQAPTRAWRGPRRGTLMRRAWAWARPAGAVVRRRAAARFRAVDDFAAMIRTPQAGDRFAVVCSVLAECSRTLGCRSQPLGVLLVGCSDFRRAVARALLRAAVTCGRAVPSTPRAVDVLGQSGQHLDLVAARVRQPIDVPD